MKFYEGNIKYWMIVLIVMAVAFILNFLIKRGASAVIRKYSSKINTDPTNFSFLKNSITVIIYTIAIIVIFSQIPSLKNLGTALFASAGILAAIIGFASQKAFSNIISGVFILIFKPFGVGDVIELDVSSKGTVEEITLRHTIIRDYENRRIVIPNSIISDATIVNSHLIDERIRKHIIFDISYDSNVDHAKSILEEEMLKHPLLIDGRTKEQKQEGEPMLLLRVTELGAYYVRIKAYAWFNNNDDAFAAQCELNEIILKRFRKEGIVIPYPHQVFIQKTE